MSRSRTPGERARIACLLEVSARKPGNVHRFRDFEDATFLDFLLSASAIGAGIDRARSEGVGAAVLRIIEDTAGLVRTNTNLGMALLLAPLAAVPEGIDARSGVAKVLAATTVADSILVYRAIRRARPGGLGRVEAQDVAREPTVPLVDAMRLAADRDLVARQYAADFAEVFDVTLPALAAALGAGRVLETAIVAAHLATMAACPDTLIARKLGDEVARESSRRAAALLADGWPDAPGSGDRLAALDAWHRDDGHARNPGATADLVAAALFVALGDATIPLPLPQWNGAPVDGISQR